VSDKDSKWQFHLTGGSLCLDFANTVSWRRGLEPIERLKSYGDLVSFSRQASVVDASEAQRLLEAAARQPRRAARALKDAVDLRALIDRIFNAVVEGSPASRTDLNAINARLVDFFACMRIVGDGARYAWDDGRDAMTLDRMLPPVVRSAAELLTSTELSRLRRCGAANCGWLFVDLSPNQRRRWCDMRVCGNRAKARRHYHHVGRS
jgi:predicted RNA-binding Zn ribbon-like protein